MIITMQIRNRQRDFKVNELQNIKDTLEILALSGYLKLEEKIVVHSVRNDVDVNIESNYLENEIYGGDILIIS